MPSQRASRFSATPRTVPVQRVVVATVPVDHNYARVELCIDDIEHEFSGPDAQVLGAQINMAGGGMFQHSTREDDLDRRLAVMQEAAARLKPLARRAITEGGKSGDDARSELHEAIDWLAKGCPPIREEAANAA